MPPWLTSLLQLLPEVLKGVAALLWPIVIIVLLLVFKSELQGLIRGRKLKRGKLFGQEFELEEELNRLDEATKGLAETPPPPPEEPPSGVTPGVPPPQPGPPDVVREVLAEAGSSPKAALMLLASEMEAELRRLLESHGAPLGPRTTFRDSARFLEQRGELPREFLESMIKFRDVRNRIIHGYEAESDDIIRAIDLGLRILRAIRSVPRGRHEQDISRSPT